MLFSQLTWYLVVLGIFVWSPPLPLSPLSLNCKAFKDTDCLYFIFISICGSASHRVASLHWCVEVRMGWNKRGGEAGPLQPMAVHFLQDDHPTTIFIAENVNLSLRCCLLRKTFMIFLTVHVFLGFWVSVLCTSPVVCIIDVFGGYVWPRPLMGKPFEAENSVLFTSVSPIVHDAW